MEYRDFINKLYIKGTGIIKAKLTSDLFICSETLSNGYRQNQTAIFDIKYKSIVKCHFSLYNIKVSNTAYVLTNT